MSSQTLGHSLMLGLDLSVLPTPLSAPLKVSPHILIIGGGVTGLTTSWLLLDKGYRVTILSKAWSSSFSEGQERYVANLIRDDSFLFA